MAAEPATETSIRLPFRLGPYLLFDRIGHGGMAEIFLSRGRTQLGIDRLAVVKLLLPSLARDQLFAEQLASEARLAAQLSHANVVQTFDLGRDSERLYIAMEYVEGFDLNDVLRRCSRAKIAFPVEFAFFVAGEVLRALDYAHRRTDASGTPLGIVHCDVSPSNVLLSLEGEVKLCDFGIARALGALPGVATRVEGKAGYMSPEHARGSTLSAQSDIFSASVVIWELLAGRRMVKASNASEMLEIARAGHAPPLPDRGYPDHDRLASILARGLAREPEARYRTAVEMGRELDAYMSTQRLIGSPIRLGEFLTTNFGDEVIRTRRARERAAAALDRGPPLTVSVVATAPATTAARDQVGGKAFETTTEREIVGEERSDFRRIDEGARSQPERNDVVSDAFVAPAAGSSERAVPVAQPAPVVSQTSRTSARFYAVIAAAGLGLAFVAGLLGYLLASR